MAKKITDYQKQANDWIASQQQNLINPVGSITNVYGSGGTPRHIGDFTENNPYLSQLRLAKNNQDADALFELAVQWQADYANRQMQLEENKAILDEQREYDSPLAQVQRQRDAGINPDLAGSSGGSTSAGSSAQLTNPGLADQQGQTKFSNKYDNTALVFEGVNTALSGISTLTGAFSGISSTIAQFKKLPSEIALNEASAGLQNAQANEITSLLDGRKKSLALQNSAQTLGIVESLMPKINPDSTDEDFNNIVAAAGIPEELQPDVVKALKSAQSNPGFLANWKNQIVADRQAQAEMETFTGQVFQNLVEEGLQLREMQLDFDIMSQSIANKVQRFLTNDPQYAENLADTERLNAANNADSQELLKEQIRRDFSAYQQGLDNLVTGVQTLEARQDELKKIQTKRGLNSVEQLEFDTNNMRIAQMKALGAQEVGRVYSMLNDARRQKFYLVNNSGYNQETGSMAWLGSGFSDDTLIYGQIAFSDVLSGVYTSQQLAQEWSKIALQGASAGAQLYMGYRIGNIGKPAALEQDYKFNKTTGKYEIIGGKVRTYGNDQDAPYDIFQSSKSQARSLNDFKF